MTGFDWGAAWTLPFTPALHYRRVILAAARWQLPARALPGRTAPQGQWADAVGAWRRRARVPSRVLLSQGDQHLPLDLSGDLSRSAVSTWTSCGPKGTRLRSSERRRIWCSRPGPVMTRVAVFSVPGWRRAALVAIDPESRPPVRWNVVVPGSRGRRPRAASIAWANAVSTSPLSASSRGMAWEMGSG